jgi:hypothetical protein
MVSFPANLQLDKISGSGVLGADTAVGAETEVMTRTTTAPTVQDDSSKSSYREAYVAEINRTGQRPKCRRRSSSKLKSVCGLVSMLARYLCPGGDRQILVGVRVSGRAPASVGDRGEQCRIEVRAARNRIRSALPCACRTRELNCSYEVIAASFLNSSPTSAWQMLPTMPSRTLENGVSLSMAWRDLDYVSETLEPCQSCCRD